MAEDSSAGGIVKFGLGLGAGFGLYFLIRNLHFGSGFGFGGGRGDGTTPPPSGHALPETPTLPRDEQPLLYVAAHPEGFQEASKLPDPTSRARRDAIFLPIELGTATFSADDVYRRMTDVLRSVRDKKTSALSLDNVIARIKAGSRDDVRLVTPGSIRQGTWDDVKDSLLAAGIKHWLLWKEFPADRRPGEAAKPSRWDLYDKIFAAGNPDKNGHYLVENRGTAYWNLVGSQDQPPRVSGNARGQYGETGRGYYQGGR